METSVEVSRNNVTVVEFFAVIKKACEKRGMVFGLDRDVFEHPVGDGEDARYYVRDGIKYYTVNGYTVQMPGDDAACKSEVCRNKPYDYQAYIENWDGTAYNEICEFTFDDEKRGHGYYYQLDRK